MPASRRSLLLFLPFVASARAIVIREGVPDPTYLAPANEFPALADLPGKGHGTLIRKQWVVTAAHAVHERFPESVTIARKRRRVAETTLHPDFKRVPPPEMKGDAARLISTYTQMRDIALLRLIAPIEDVKPAELYRSTDEVGKLVTLYGKGATGNGATGEYANSPHHGLLRRARNRIISAKDQWLAYAFDCSSSAPPSEGVIGSGDSGGPVLVQAGGFQKLAGVTSWKSWEGDLKDFRAGVCGQMFYCSRISHYAEWIDRVTAGRQV
jgi:hypothetical protein